jgi:hypothetical protein
MKGAVSCIRHEEDKKNRDLEYDYFPSILCINFQSGLRIPFLIIRFFGNERRSVPHLQLHLGDVINLLINVFSLMLAIYTLIYLTLYTFSFEINESRLSDTRCCIVRRCTRRSLPNYFDMTSYHWKVRLNTVTWHWWMNGENNVTSYTKCSLPRSIVHILIQPLLFA